MMTDRLPCPYCPKVCVLAGPDGVLFHILNAHPSSDMATDIRIELAFIEEAS